MSGKVIQREQSFGRPSWTVLGFALLGLWVLAAGTAQASSSITRTSSWTYNATTGLVTSETVQSTSTSPSSCVSSTGDNTCSVTTSYTYDAYGNKLTTTVTGTSLPTPLNGSWATIAARTTTMVYDSQGEFATKITNPLGQSETWAYDPRFGVPTAHTGPNGLTTSWSYDTLGRKTAENRADGTYTNWTYNYNQFFGPLTEYYIVTSYYGSDGSEAAPTTYAIYDSLGRQEGGAQQAYNGTTSTSIGVLTQYNANGQVAQTSLPYFSGAQVWTTYTYDALGRVLTEVKPYGTTGSTTSYGYNGLTTTVTDAQGRTVTTTDNDMGLPVSVTNAASSTTAYVYDALGDLTQITDPAGHVTTYTYDNEGRKIAMSDPDRGSWTYAYDALGELTQQTDADGQATTITYDALGRKLTERQAASAANFVYDASGHGIGQLSSSGSYKMVSGSWQPLYTQSLGYDSYGRPVLTGNSFSGGTAVSTWTNYDAASRISTVTYPSGYKVKDSYNAIGTLASVAGTPVGSSTSQTLWTLNTLNASGQVTAETLGNGVVVANTYDPNTTALTATMAGLSSATQTGDLSTANVANLSYRYDNLGNLNSRSDADADTPNTSTAPTPLSETFGYDTLYRLTSETLPGSVVKTFQYDALGDMTYKSDVGTYTYANSAHLHAISSIAGHAGSSYNITTSYTYDANGNQLTGNGYSMAWTAFNMPLSITKGSVSVAYTYDPDYNRASQAMNVGGVDEGVTNYVNDPISGVRSEQAIASSGAVTWTDYISAGPELIGIHVTPASGGAYNRFFIRDHLGSIAVVTGDIGCSGLTLGGANSCLVERDSYDVWGKRRNAITWADDINNSLASVTTRGFTGHEMVQNTSSGFELVNMNARMYDPTIGRFMSTDPIIQTPTNLQDLNAYSYVLNNPLCFVDPSGQGFFSIFLAVVAIAVAVVLDQPEVLPYVLGPSGLGLSAAVAGEASVVLAGAAAGAISSGGSWQGALIGAVSAGAFNGVGRFLDPAAPGQPSEFEDIFFNGARSAVAKGANYLVEVAGDGLVGGLRSIAQGSGFEAGFLAAGFSSAVGQGLDDLGTNAATGFQYDNALTSGVTGGLGSVLGGGKFANGAVTGAFGYLFNRCGADPAACFGLSGSDPGAEAMGYAAQQAVSYAERAISDTLSFFGGFSFDETLGYGKSFEAGIFVTPGTGDVGVFETSGDTMGSSYSLFPSFVVGGQVGTFSGAGQSYNINTPYGGASVFTGSSTGESYSPPSVRLGITSTNTQGCYISFSGHGC